jgi:2'-5' RNA ligase
MRLFTAVSLPEQIRERIESICHGLPGVRWVSPEQMHLTLRFLGDDIPEARLEEIVEALTGIDGSAFTLRLSGISRFLRPRVPQVLWLGVEAGPGLADLYRRVESVARSLGFPPEKRTYEPHVTLARLKGVPDRRVEEYLRLYSEFDAGACQVDEFFLYSSVLRPNGAVHAVEEVFPLSDRRQADRGVA